MLAFSNVYYVFTIVRKMDFSCSDKQGQIFVCLFGLRLYVPVNNISVMSGRSHRFLGITNTFWEVNVSCSRIQHGDLSQDRTPDLPQGQILVVYLTMKTDIQTFKI